MDNENSINGNFIEPEVYLKSYGRGKRNRDIPLEQNSL